MDLAFIILQTGVRLLLMNTFIFWDIENVSIHNLERIMERTGNIQSNTKRYVVYSKIKEERKKDLLANNWILTDTGEISKNSADKKIKDMIDEILEDENIHIDKIIIITEDKGFYKTAKKIIARGIQVEIICGTKNPSWVKRL